MKRILLLLAATLPAFAGQSVQYGTNAIYNSAIPNTHQNRWEERIEWTGSSLSTHIIDGSNGSKDAVGWRAYFQTSMTEPTLSIAASSNWDTADGVTIPLDGLTDACVYLRFQRDIVNQLNEYEAWDCSGYYLFGTTSHYNGELVSGTGIQMGYGNEATVDVAFMRVSTTLVPMHSKPPTTFSSDPDRVFEWKFDNSLSDATGNGYDAIYGNFETPNYVTSLFETPPVSVVALNRKPWAEITTARAGYPWPLDGTQSYSELDNSATVTCAWTQISGPSTLQWPLGQSSCTEAPVGSIFGDYVLQLTVTDANGNTAVSEQHIGAVAEDSKCVVVNQDANADTIYGPLIAYGCNPWGFADQWEYGSLLARCAVYGMPGTCDTGAATSPYSFAALQWEQTGAGTVSYIWGGKGEPYTGVACSTPLTDLSPQGSLTIQIHEASCLDLTSFPTRIVIGIGSVFEEIRICRSNATSGPATLTVCYDGRSSMAAADFDWPASTNVQQFKVTGTGTNFQTDANAAVCPIGFPSPTGPSYASGSAALTAGSMVVTGTGFSAGMVGSYLVANATHGGGTAYVFIRQIAAYISATSITLASAYPSDSDTGSFGYNITAAARTLDLRAAHAVDTTATGEWLWNASGCESATTLYLNPWVAGNEFVTKGGHTAGFNNGTTYGGLPYSVTDTSGWISNSPLGGINFYGESGAWRKLGLRSGLTAPFNAANLLDDNLPKSPWGNRDGNGYYDLITGGALVFGFNSAILGAGTGPGTGHGPAWGDLRSYAKQGIYNLQTMYNGGGAPQCWNQDTRTNSYSESWLVLAALYDPNPTWKQVWLDALPMMQSVDASCAQSDSSFSGSASWGMTGGFTFGPQTLHHGTTAMTGATTLVRGTTACTGTAMGIGTVTTGNGTLNITSGAIGGGSDSITLTGTMSTQPYTITVMFSGSGSSIQLAGLWPGDTGNVTWMSLNTALDIGPQNYNQTAYGTDYTDTADLLHNYACLITGPNTMVLDHPWAGNDGSAYYGQSYVLSGFGIQSFYNGINEYRLRLMANSTLPSASYYRTLATSTAEWIKNTGFHPTGLYVPYGNFFDSCVTGNALITNTSAANTLPQITPGCNYTIFPTNPSGLATNRAQNAELGIATSVLYEQGPTSENKTWGDQVYGAVFGNQLWNTGGVYYDQYSSAMTGNNLITNLSPTSQAADKWPGFYCGMGACDVWPAARLGGVDPPSWENIRVAFTLSDHAGAVAAKFSVTAPDGLMTPTTCSVSPCSLPLDDRTGSAIYTISYLNSGGGVIATGPNTILDPSGAPAPPTPGTHPYILLGRK